MASRGREDEGGIRTRARTHGAQGARGGGVKMADGARECDGPAALESVIPRRGLGHRTRQARRTRRDQPGGGRCSAGRVGQTHDASASGCRRDRKPTGFTGSGGVAERKTPAAARVGGSGAAALLGHGWAVSISMLALLYM